MTEPAGDEEIAGTLNRDRLLILFSYLIWISSGFLFSSIILFFTERIAILDVVVIMPVRLVLSYFLIHGDAVIIDQLISYFRKKIRAENMPNNRCRPAYYLLVSLFSCPFMRSL